MFSKAPQPQQAQSATPTTPFFKPEPTFKSLATEQAVAVRAPEAVRRLPIQAKLTVGQPNDKYEQEADAMADKVVQRWAMPNAVAAIPTITPFNINAAQRACAACEKEDKDHIQRKESGEMTASPSVESRLSATKGGGNPLPESTRTQMESSIGADFSNVRVHTGGEAVQLSQDLSAHAFTHGSDVYFNSGKFAPDTEGGRHLLAHELTHTVQQGGGSIKSVQRAPAACGIPLDCPPNFCEPFTNAVEIASALSLVPTILAGIATQVSSKVVPLWWQYVRGGAAPQDLTADFGQDFRDSPTTTVMNSNLATALRSALVANPPVFPSGSNSVTLGISSLIPTTIANLNTTMNFNIVGDIPGNIAGGIGTTQLACAMGALPSPFNDSREAIGHIRVDKNSTSSVMTITPTILYIVKDTIDLCPGNCGTGPDDGLINEQIATVPLSRLEASGIAGDVPFTVTFPAQIAPFTMLLPTPLPPSPVAPSVLALGEVIASRLNIRGVPNTHTTVIGHYNHGEVIQIECHVIGEPINGNTRWYHTNKGYVSAQHVRLSSGNPFPC